MSLLHRCDSKPLDDRCPECREGAALEAWMAYQVAADREAAGAVWAHLATGSPLILQGLPEWWTALEILWRRN